MARQPDLFAPDEPDLFPAEPLVYRGDPDRVRARLRRILAEAQGAATLPWDRRRAELYRTVVPQMTLWLPEHEAQQWRLDFESAMDRLGAG